MIVYVDIVELDDIIYDYKWVLDDVFGFDYIDRWLNKVNVEKGIVMR